MWWAWRTRFYDERDRRYGEVGVEREKALKIKEEADLRALKLAEQIQTYKDEQANELRSQIERERGSYVTRIEMEPLKTYVTARQGRETAGIDLRGIITLVILAVSVAINVYQALKGQH